MAQHFIKDGPSAESVYTLWKAGWTAKQVATVYDCTVNQVYGITRGITRAPKTRQMSDERFREICHATMRVPRTERWPPLSECIHGPYSAFELAAMRKIHGAYRQRWNGILWECILIQPDDVPLPELITIHDNYRIDQIRKATAKKRNLFREVGFEALGGNVLSGMESENNPMYGAEYTFEGNVDSFGDQEASAVPAYNAPDSTAPANPHPDDVRGWPRFIAMQNKRRKENDAIPDTITWQEVNQLSLGNLSRRVAELYNANCMPYRLLSPRQRIREELELIRALGRPPLPDPRPLPKP